MGLLVEGTWHTDWYDTKTSGGEFIRSEAQFRNWVYPADLAKDGEFVAEAGRYHLFVSLACPWAHRTLIFRKLLGLEETISVSLVKPEMLDHGWELFPDGPLPELDYLHQVYTQHDANYSGRVTVPVLWDKKLGRIVNNESAEIIRILNQSFAPLVGATQDYYPDGLKAQIDEVNEFVYHRINNGVYKVGFATAQAVYESHLQALFAALDELELRLSGQPYLAGEQLTEADWRLFTTLIRFDAVYVGHFKCNLRRIEDYPNLSNYLRQLYQVPGVAETVNFDHIKTHYYYSHTMINPNQIVPTGPELDFTRPHNRA